MTDETRPAAKLALEASRQRVEESLAALREAVRESSGGRLGRRAWTLPLLAAAVGFSLALVLRQRGRRLRAASEAEATRDDY